MYGNDYEYAGTRLVGTIVRLAKNNEPVQVEDIGMSGVCTITFLDGKKVHDSCHIDELNLQPVRLGYCNFSGTCIYLSRIPMRRDYKQGLRANTVFTPTGGGFHNVPLPALRLTIMGKYPTFEKVINETSGNANVFKGKSLAFHRHWAISCGRELLYKNNVKVGDIKNGEVHLAERYWHLKEYLERCIK